MVFEIVLHICGCLQINLSQIHLNVKDLEEQQKAIQQLKYENQTANDNLQSKDEELQKERKSNKRFISDYISKVIFSLYYNRLSTKMKGYLFFSAMHI